MATLHVGALQTYVKIQDAINAAQENDNIFVHGGVYAEVITSKKKNVVITGQGAGAVTIDGTGQSQETVRFTHDNCKLERVKVVGPDGKYAIRYYTGSGFEFNDLEVDVRQGAFEPYRGATFNRCVFSSVNSANTKFAVIQQNVPENESVVCNFCLFSGIRLVDLRSGNFVLNNCTGVGSVGFFASVSESTKPRKLRIINTILTANASTTGSGLGTYVIRNKTGDASLIEIGNSLIVPSPLNAGKDFCEGPYTDLGGNMFKVSPLLTDLGYNAYVSMEIDDAMHEETFMQLADKLEAYGWRGTWQIDTSNVKSWDNVVALHKRGHEIASHTRRHINLSDMKAFTIKSSSPCTLTIDTGANSLTTSLGLSLNLLDYQNVGKMVEYINTQAGYTAESTQQKPAVYASLGSPKNLKNVTAVDIGAAVTTLSYDRAKVYTDEVDGSAQDLITKMPDLTIGDLTLCSPGHHIDATGEQYLKDKGWLGARKGTNTETLRAETLNIFHTNGPRPAFFGNDFEKTVPIYVESAKLNGGVICLYTHGISIGEWANGWADCDKFLAELKKSGAVVLPRREMIKKIKAKAQAVDGKTYKKEPRPVNARLLAGSSAFAKGVVIPGVNDSGQTDLYGNPTPTVPNIGVDQSAPEVIPPPPGPGPQPGDFSVWVPFIGTMPSLAFAPAAPAKLKEVQVWDKIVGKNEIDGVPQ